MESVNLNNLSVDDSGRVTFSGLNSGIDAVGTVDKIIAARRIPVDTLETRISANELKITALNQLKAALTDVKDSLSNLFGSVSFGGSSDIFNAKVAFSASSRLDGATPTTAANLVGVSTTNAAAAGSHDIQILRTATAHKISSDSQTSTTTALGFANTDTFTINDPDGTPRTINVNSATTLGDLRDAINAANSGTTATGVSASIVSVSTTEHYLILTKDETGAAMTLADTSGTALQDVGILTGASAIANELQAAQTAQIYVDGVLDQTNMLYESSFQSASTALVGSTGQLNFGAYGTVAYNSSDTLATLATNITAAHADLTATVVTDGAGVRLEITGLAAFTITEDLAGTAITDLGINNKRKAVERTTNTVNDLFTGVTLSLFQAEAGTNINISIDKDLNQIKTEIVAFVDAYNVFKEFMNGQRQNRPENAEDTDLTGVLIRSSVLEQVENEVGRILNTAVSGLTGDVFSTLPQLDLVDTITTGISTVSRSDDPLLDGTLKINEAKLDEALLNKTAEFEQLFTFSFTSGDSRVSLLGFDGDTTYSATGYTLNIQPSSGENQILQSETFDNAAWTLSNATVSADAATAPNSTTTADGLVASAVSTTHSIANTTGISVTSGQSYLMSVYAKQGDKDSVRLSLEGAFGTDTQVEFDLNAGTITNTGINVDQAKIEDAGNGWYRLTVMATATSTANGTFRFTSMNGTSDTFAGDGSTVSTNLWGAQLENVTTDSTVLDETGVTATGASVTANTVTGPDGVTVDADAIVSDGIANPHYVAATSTIAVTSGTTYDYVAILKQGAQPRARLELPGAGFAANTYAEFDLAGGTVTATGAGAASSSIEDMGSGWYKVTLTAAATGTSTEQPRIYSMDATNDLSYVAAGTDTYFWDQRFLAQSTTGSYVPTTAAAETNASATANIDGAAIGTDDGSATVTGNTIVVNTGDADGLRLYFDSISYSTSVQIDFTVGFGAQLFYEIDQILLDTTDVDGNKQLGILAAEIDALTDQNESNQDRVDEMLVRLEIQRQSLLERFIKMETAMATADRIMDSLRQTMDALLGNSN